MSLPLSLFLCCSLRHDMIPCQIVGNDINLPRLHPFSWGLLESWLTSSDWADAHAAHTHTHHELDFQFQKRLQRHRCNYLKIRAAYWLRFQILNLKSVDPELSSQDDGDPMTAHVQHRSGSNGHNVMWHLSSVYRFWAAKAESLRETKISHTRHAHRSTK